MRLTKFAHSCVRLSDGDRALVIDPGIFADVEAALDGADAVLITHEHPDHVDVDRLRELLEGRPVFGPAPIAEMLPQVTVVEPGRTFSAAGFTVETVGGQHALIHPTVPVIPNIGYLVEEAVYHPGDSLIVPTKEVQTLLAPIHAPWSKTAEVADFVVGVKPRQVFPIHDGLLNEHGLGFTEAHVSRIGGSHGAEFRHLQPGETVDA